MAEIVGLAASIVQLGGAGVKLSIELHDFITATARADKDVCDLAEELETTSSTLDHVGSTLRARHIRALASPKAIKHATKIVHRCRIIFGEVEDTIGKRWKVNKRGEKKLTWVGKLSWPLEKERVELLRQRLDSLKLDLSLLLTVLQLAQKELQSNLASEMQEKRREIRLLFLQCETAMQREKDLENKFRDLELQHKVHPDTDRQSTCTVNPNPQGPSIASQTSSNHPQAAANTEAMRRLEMYGSTSSDNDTTTTDDEGETLTVRELERCARQIQRLLQRIEDVQNGVLAGRVVKHSRKKRMYKSYQRFCRKFERDLGNSCQNLSVPTTPIHDDQRNVSPSHIHAGFRNMTDAPAVSRNPEPFISNSMQGSVTHDFATAIHPQHWKGMQLHDTSLSSVVRISALRPAKRLQHSPLPSYTTRGQTEPIKAHSGPSLSSAPFESHHHERYRINYTENLDEDTNMAATYQSIPLQDLNRPSDENHNAPAPQSHRRTLSDRGRNLIRQTGGITTGQFRSCQFATIADVSPSPTRRPRLNTDTAVGQSGIQRMVPGHDGDVADSPIDAGAFQAAIGFGMDMNFQGDTSPLSALRKSNSTSSLSQTAAILDLEDRKLGGPLHDYPQSMLQRQPQVMMPSELPTIVSSNPHVAGMPVHSFLSPCSSPMLTTECNDLSYPRTTGKLNDSPKWMSSGLEEVDFELEEVSNDVSNTESIIILPGFCEDAESDRGVATLQDTGVMDRFKELQFAGSSTDEESKERIYLRKKKQWNAGIFKRTHSQSVEEESSYSDNGSQDDNKPEARRLRRKLRRPRPLDRRGSLIFEDKGFSNTDPYSMPYTTASPYHTIPTTLTPEMPTYTYLPPLISSAYPTTLPGHLPSMKSEYYAEEDLSPFGVGYAAIGGIDIPSPHAYADHNAHVRIPTRQQSYSYVRKGDRDEISKTGVCSEQSQQETVYDGALYRSPPTSQKHLFPITMSMEHGTEAKSETGAEEGARCGHPGCGKVFFRPDLLKRHEERHTNPSTVENTDDSTSTHDFDAVDSYIRSIGFAPNHYTPSTVYSTIPTTPPDTINVAHLPSIRSDCGEDPTSFSVGYSAINKQKPPELAYTPDTAGQSSSVKFTKNGRITKAKKGRKDHYCECGWSYTRLEHLRRHQQNRVDEIHCKNPGCGKASYCLDFLQRHEEQHNNFDDTPRMLSSWPLIPSLASTDVQEWQAGMGHDPHAPIQGWKVSEASTAQNPEYSPSRVCSTIAIDIPQSLLDSASDESLQSREWTNVIDGAPLSTTEAAGRDIVDILLEQWTVPIGA